MQAIEKFYRWGEYDSLIVRAEPWIQQSGIEKDSAYPKVMTYLGISYHALQDSVRGDSVFKVALQCDSTLELDLHYVSPKTFARFQQLAPKKTLPSAFVSSSTRDNLSAAEQSKPVVKVRPPSKPIARWKLWTGGTVVVAGGLAAYAYFQNPSPLNTSTFIDLR